MSIQQLIPATTATAHQPPQQEPRFLKENWKVVLGNECPVHLRFVRVISGVANITNGVVLIRLATSYLPDGFYIIGEGGVFNNVAPGSSPKWMTYPDVQTCSPTFHTLTPSQPIPFQIVSEAISFVEHVRRQADTGTYGYRTNVVMMRDGLFMSTDPKVSFALPLHNLPTGNEIALSPLHLKMALVEMLRYQETFISQDGTRGGDSPVIFGKDWGHCALVKPYTANTPSSLASGHWSGLQYH